jgi:ribonuclease P protein component
MKATKDLIQDTGRLKAQAAFDSLRKTKTRWVSQGFALQAIPSATPDKVAFCVITSKKTAKLATDRNTMRRRLRAITYEILPIRAKRGLDYMLVARGACLTRNMDEMRNDLIWCLKKLDLLRPE